MNKLLPFLAFAVFTLIACSEDKPAASHSELCAKKPVTRECLVGRWALDKIEGSSECKPNKEMYNNSLKLQANGQFTFNGGIGDTPNEIMGNWELNEAIMKINCTIGDFNPEIDYPVDATIEIIRSGGELRITTKGYSSFLQCSVGSQSASFTEVYTWQGSN